MKISEWNDAAVIARWNKAKDEHHTEQSLKPVPSFSMMEQALKQIQEEIAASLLTAVSDQPQNKTRPVL